MVNVSPVIPPVLKLTNCKRCFLTPDSDIKLVNSKDGFFSRKSNNAEVIPLDLDLCGKNLHFDISVTSNLVSLEAIVPIARIISDKIADVAVQENLDKGERVPCRQGCTSCCNYLVTASSAEIFSIVDNMKKNDSSFRKYIQRNALLACKKILKKRPPEFRGHNQLNKLSTWYKSLNISCPFIFEGSCSIYDIRPISCREYFITGSSDACKGKSSAAQVLDLPLSVANILNDLCNQLHDQADTSVILPFFQVWANENNQMNMRKYLAQYLVKKFVELLENQASKTRQEALALAN